MIFVPTARWIQVKLPLVLHARPRRLRSAPAATVPFTCNVLKDAGRANSNVAIGIYRQFVPEITSEHTEIAIAVLAGVNKTPAHQPAGLYLWVIGVGCLKLPQYGCLRRAWEEVNRGKLPGRLWPLASCQIRPMVGPGPTLKPMPTLPLKHSGHQ